MLLLLLFSCSNQNQKQANDTLTIDFNPEQNAKYSDILETVFIKLETNENCLIDKTITQIEFASDKLFILSGGTRNIFAFDLSGNFLAQIGSKGNGPGEHIVPMSFSIDNKRNVISILDIAQKKIIKYDLNNFTFVSEEEMNYDSSCFEYLGDNKIVWKNIDYRSDYSKSEFLITDTKKGYLDNVIDKKIITGYSTGRLKTMYKTGDKVFAYSQYDSQIYCFQDDDVVPVYNFTFGKHSFPTVEYLQKISANNINFIPVLAASDFISGYSVFDIDQTMCIYYSVAQIPYIGIYDKKKNLSYSYTQTTFQENLQIGKIDNIAGVTDNYIVAVLQPFELLDKKTEGYKFTRNLEPLVAKSLSDDNPILCLFRIKN